MALAKVKRVISPNLNPTGLAAAAAAVYAAAVMIWNATHHHGTIDPQVIVAALAAAVFLYSRFLVTPVADPKDGAGVPLVPAPAPPALIKFTGGITEEQAAAVKAALASQVPPVVPPVPPAAPAP